MCCYLTEVCIDILPTLLMQFCATDLLSEAGDTNDVSWL